MHTPFYMIVRISAKISVNMDLSTAERVLPNAPLAGYDEDFSTIGMKSFDLVSDIQSLFLN